jgi:hypothetical protein
MDLISSVLQAPINTILILGGIVFAFFSVFEVSQGSVRLRAEKTNFVPLILGGVLILSGIFLPRGSAEPTPPVASTDSPATQPSVATEAIPTTAVSTNAPEPTATTVVKTLADGCFSARTWKPNSINTDALTSVSTQDNCYNLNSLGISVAGGNIRLLPTAPKTKSSSGISMPINDQSVIEFKLTIDSLYIIYPDEAAYITFGIAPTDDPMAERGAGRFKLVVDKTGNNQTVFYFLANAEQSYGSKWPSQHPSYRRTYSIRFVLKSISMEIYVDDVKFKDEVTLPPGTKVFNIGYYMPVLAGADIEIADLTINGVTP